tara:strand:- start:1177 stop:1854 length:678 start_codon:yes stop_codon:yes gene_type:complete
MNKVMAEILGLLCSEGNYREYYSNYRYYDKRRGKYYYRKNARTRILEFCNKETNLIFHFIKLLEKEFNYSPRLNMTHHDLLRIFITKRSIMDRILNYTNLGCTKWTIPQEIINGNKEVKRGFVRGFFYGDGCVDKTHNNKLRIRFTSVNSKGVKFLSNLLNNLNISHSLNGPYFRKEKNRRVVFEILIRMNSNQRFLNNIIDNSDYAGQDPKLSYAGIIMSIPNA